MIRLETAINQHDDSRRLSCTHVIVPKSGQIPFCRECPFDVVDYGDGDKWDILRADGTELTLTNNRFKRFEWMSSGCAQVLGGAAHLQKPRTDRSLAQPLSELDIRRLAELRRVYLFPDKMTTTCRRFFHQAKEPPKKTGLDDCHSMKNWVLSRSTQLPNLRLSFGETGWSRAYREYNERTNQVLNAARAKEKSKTYKYDELARYVAELNHLLCMRPTYKVSTVYTVMACFVDPLTGEARRLDGRLVGARFVYNYVVGSPFGQGSVARSNIMQHDWMHSLCRKECGSAKDRIPVGLLNDAQHKEMQTARAARRRELRLLIKTARDLRDNPPAISRAKEAFREISRAEPQELF